MSEIPQAAIDAAAEALKHPPSGAGMTVAEWDHARALATLEAAAPHICAAEREAMRGIATGPSVWVVLTRNGMLSAIFATEELADRWIKDNPTVYEGAVSEPWHLHTPEESA